MSRWCLTEDDREEYRREAHDARAERAQAHPCLDCGDRWTEDHDCPVEAQARLERILGYDADTEIGWVRGSEALEISLDAAREIAARLERLARMEGRR